MRSLKILIFELLAFTMVSPLAGQSLSARVALYDFTDEAARDFYLLSPVVLVGYDFPSSSRLNFNVTAGFGYRSFPYRDHQHRLYLMPIFISLKYKAANPGSTVQPYIFGGGGLLGKEDRNSTLDDTHYAFTYGYHAGAGVDIKLKERLSLNIDVRYNLLVNPAMEDINVSGVISAVGVAFWLRKENSDSNEQSTGQ
jgi:hypothetical protein